MTLSAIKAMFIPGDYWKVEYTAAEMLKKRPFRQVHKCGSTELVWIIGSLHKFYTPWPKASQIISAEPGRLEFRYEGHTESFIFSRLTEPEDIQQAITHITILAAEDAAAREADRKQKQETQARLDAEARKSREDKIRNLQPVTVWELIEALRENDLTISPGTIGALRKKIVTIDSKGWTVSARKAPRFTYECQPSILYLRVHDHLLLHDLAEPVETGAPDPDMDHLFGITRTPEPALVDAFADF